MKLNLNGKINKIYVQSLCMMFYHGIKFPENAGGLRKIKIAIGKPVSYDEYMACDENGEPPRRVETAQRVFDEVCKLHEEM